MRAERCSRLYRTSTLKMRTMKGKYIMKMDTRMIAKFMTNRLPIFAKYHSNFWYLMI